MDKSGFARLPKWAQAYIRSLESQVASYIDTCNSEVTENTKIYYDIGVLGRLKSRVPERSTVYFKVHGGEFGIRISNDDDSIEVSSQSGGAMIAPAASNHFSVYIEE